MKQQRKIARSQAGGGPPSVPTSNSVPVTRKFISRPDGSTVTQLGIDVTDLSAPERHYSADEAWVRSNGSDAVYLYFVQHTVLGAPRSLVAVKLYNDSAKRFYEGCAPVRPILDKFAERHSLSILDASAGKHSAEPPQSVSLVASFAQVAFAGFEAEMSFFHLSPYTVHRAERAQASSVPAEPIVQVDMSTGILLAVLRELETIADDLPGGEE